MPRWGVDCGEVIFCKGRLVAAVLVGLWSQAGIGLSEDARPERFENTTAGVSIERPAGWHSLTSQQIVENRERVRMADEELQKAIQERASLPLFAFSKHEEPYESLNPSIQVGMRPLAPFEGKPAAEILAAIVGAIRSMAPDFTIVKDVHEVEISGLKGAGLEAKYTLGNAGGAKFPVWSRMLVVPRGKLLFIIGMSGTQEGPDVCAKDFAAALASIRIQP